MHDAHRTSQDLLHSADPAALSGLTYAQKEALTAVLDEYLRALEAGCPPSTDEIVAAHPELAVPLRAYLQSLAELHDVAASLGAHLPDEAATAEPPSANTRLGDFELAGEIGRGGMGIVYEARQISLGRRVAVKVLPFAAVLDARQIARFKNEAQAAAQLQHPHIVPVYAVGVERGIHYYAMQLIEGQSLDRILARLRGECPPEIAATSAEDRSVDTLTNGAPADSLDYFRRVVELGIQAALALHAAHSDGILHRDVKPSNLLLDASGKLWITDFGLARCQRDLALTQTGDVVGTRQYMSPEQARGQQALIDHRTDIYALGVTLYEMLTLRPALDGDTTVAYPAASVEPVRLRAWQPKLPLDLETVVLKAMAAERDDRYLTAQELADDLGRVLEGKPTVARPPTLVDRLGRFARRHRRAVAAAAALSVAATIALAAVTILIHREKTKAERDFARAEAYFQQAQDTVESLGSSFAERLAEVPGATGVRRELLEETLGYYRRFVEQAGDDPTLRAELATTLGKIGALNDQMGLTDEALEAHDKAIALLEQLKAEQPAAADYAQRLAVCRNNLGLTLSRAGRADDARRELAKAAAEQTRLMEASPDAPGLRSELARSYVNLGDVERQAGRVAQADDAIRKAIKLQEDLAGSEASGAEAQHSLSMAYTQLAALGHGSPADAVEWYRKGVEHARAAVHANPRKVKYQSDLATTLNNLAAAQARQDELEPAAATYREAIDLQKKLLQQAPLDRAYRRDLAVSYNNLGLAYTRLRQADAAQRSYRNALGFHQQLVAERPDDLDAQSSLGGVYNNLGILFEQDGRDGEAVESYRSAIDHQKTAHEGAPRVARYREFLSKHYYNQGRVLRRLGRSDEAVHAALERKKLWPGDPERLLSVAEELAACAPSPAADSPTGSAQGAELALSTLREAAAAGLVVPDDLAQRQAFATIKNHPGFVEFVRQ
jgi:tetratricopeptide (TPR) repeat protein/tRNA A-37 threonylcarbamoyl transferase component Bud32